jgi:hypothetical protein
LVGVAGGAAAAALPFLPPFLPPAAAAAGAAALEAADAGVATVEWCSKSEADRPKLSLSLAAPFATRRMCVALREAAKA